MQIFQMVLNMCFRREMEALRASVKLRVWFINPEDCCMESSFLLDILLNAAYQYYYLYAYLYSLLLLFGVAEGEVVLDKVFLQLNCSLTQRLINPAAALSAAQLAASISSCCLKRCELWIVREQSLDLYNKSHSLLDILL